MDGARKPDEALPWLDIMSAGLGVLRLSPKEFWAMTPRELDAALTGVFGPPSSPSPPARRDLTALMERFPDKESILRR